MDFHKDFDELLAGILTDYRNQLPEADTSQGSLIFIKSACLASALWGLYKYQDWIARQIFPDTAATAQLEHHCWTRGISRKSGETDAALLTRLLLDIQTPKGGGNKFDYVRWALEVEGVGRAWCLPLAQGLGTVDVLVLAAGSEEVPDQSLLDAVAAHIEQERPVTVKQMRVLSPDVLVQDVTLVASGTGLDPNAIAADIAAHMAGLSPGEGLTIAQLNAIVVNAGAYDVSTSVPSESVEVEPYEMIRPGAINVSVAA